MTAAGQTTPANTIRFMYSYDGATWVDLGTTTPTGSGMTAGSTTGRPLSVAPFDSDDAGRNACMRGRVYGLTAVNSAAR